MKTILLCWLVLLPVALYGQDFRVSGKISDEEQPLGFVSVRIPGTTYGTLSDEQGSFRLGPLPAGKYEIEFSLVGYQVRRVTVDLKENRRLDIRLQARQDQIGEVVVSGTMKEMSRKESPVTVDVFNFKYFQKNPSPSMFEALHMVNGVRPQLNCNICNTGDIHINGMEGPYTMILIDGMPVVSSLSTVYGLSGIPNSMVERIEVIKGPASTLYGSEAVAGLINVITKSPAQMPLFSADIYTTSYQEMNADAAVRYQASPRLSGMLSLNYFKFDKRWDKNRDGFTDLTLQDRISVFNKWNWKRERGKKASLAARYVYEDRWGGQTQWNPEFRGGDSIYAESIYTKRLELIGEYALPVREDIHMSFSYNRHRQNSYYGTTFFDADQQVLFVQSVWNKRLNARHELLTGASLRYTIYDDNTVGTQLSDTNGTRNAPQQILLPGIFVQHEWSISEHSKLLSGMRYDYHSQHGSVFTPRLNYKWNNRSKADIVRLGFGNGYRVVNVFTEDHAALTGARDVQINHDLKPERSYNVNLNYQKFIQYGKGFGSMDVSLFYTYFTNRIVPDYDTDPDKIIYDNLDGYAISRGVSLNTEWTFVFPLKINTGITLMDVFRRERDETGTLRYDAQEYAPAFSGTFALSYELRKWGLSFDYTGNVDGPMLLPVLPDDYRPRFSPWFSIQNVQVTKSLSKSWKIYGGAKNLFNFMPRDPIMRAFDPFDKQVTVDNPNQYTFDPGYMYAPLKSRYYFLGFRFQIAG